MKQKISLENRLDARFANLNSAIIFGSVQRPVDTFFELRHQPGFRFPLDRCAFQSIHSRPCCRMHPNSSIHITAGYNADMKTIKNVDEYIALAPTEVRGKLEELRATIKAAAPNAEERISYGMPYYYYKGRLVYFSLWKNHIGLYAITAPVQAAHKSELEGYATPKGTLRFPLDEKLPVALITKLVKAQVKKNVEAEKK
jgi:uncharacterized protein YdhG (YjbR/CyaY superfamily)